MEFSENSCFKGQFLIAMPGLSDPNFYRSVTCMCEHTSEGALGIVVNRIAPRMSAKDIFADLNLEPVAQNKYPDSQYLLNMINALRQVGRRTAFKTPLNGLFEG